MITPMNIGPCCAAGTLFSIILMRFARTSRDVPPPTKFQVAWSLEMRYNTAVKAAPPMVRVLPVPLWI
eukprot:5324570-Amphidinium_carterae.1